jgi:hypothetical protein
VKKSKLPGGPLSTVISPEKSARFLRSLHSHWNTRAPRAKCCRVRAADGPGGASSCGIRAMAVVYSLAEALGFGMGNGP